MTRTIVQPAQLDLTRPDAKPLELAAPFDGIIIAQAWRAPVRQGQHVLVVGRIIENNRT